jgi:DNA-binding NarL/FixJ family response regulator
MIVDDHTIVRRGIKALLAETEDIQVIGEADNGLEAVRLARQLEPDVVLMDLLMPKMDGFAVCKELQDPRWSKYRETPILILSSVREESSRRRYELETGLELNVDDYVEKPVSPDILVHRVEKLIEKKQKV